MVVGAPALVELAELLAEKTRRAVTRSDADDALGLVTLLAVDTGICDHASITHRPPTGQWDTSAPTDEVAVAADELQYQLGEGPCLSVVTGTGVLVSADVGTDDRWPRWGPPAVGQGVEAVMSVHLFTDIAPALGSLNLYCASRREYTEHDLQVGRLMGAHASVALAHFHGQQHLRNAIEARHDIGIAQGIVMQQYGVNADQAFAVLRRPSQDSYVKVRLVAAEVARAGRLPLSPAAPIPALNGRSGAERSAASWV